MKTNKVTITSDKTNKVTTTSDISCANFVLDFNYNSFRIGDGLSNIPFLQEIRAKKKTA